MSNKINYVKGNVLTVKDETHKAIIHCCNDIGAFGAGIALAIRNKFPKVYQSYNNWYEDCRSKGLEYMPLGSVQFVDVDPYLAIGNMIGQHGIGNFGPTPPIRYEAIDKCLKKVHKYCIDNNSRIIAPKFGAGLAGGDWDKIEALLYKNCGDLSITIYEL
jgi:O-acetyl-ADP-ribose deacetylase (regulator of RNase III)